MKSNLKQSLLISIVFFLLPFSQIAKSDTNEEVILKCAKASYQTWGGYNLHIDKFRQDMLACLGYTAQLIRNKEIKTKWCALRIGQQEKFDKCKKFNNSFMSIERIIITEDNIQRSKIQRYSKKPTTFGGYKCKTDCSGHKAGYEWARENDLYHVDECYVINSNNSQSFFEGCLVYFDGL